MVSGITEGLGTYPPQIRGVCCIDNILCYDTLYMFWRVQRVQVHLLSMEIKTVYSLRSNNL